MSKTTITRSYALHTMVLAETKDAIMYFLYYFINFAKAIFIRIVLCVSKFIIILTNDKISSNYISEK